MITFEDFAKLEMRIGQVVSAEKVPGTDKLIKLIFDFGDEKRQIIAGIAEFFKDLSALVGRQIPVLINLEPRKFKDYESQGMILAVDVNGRPVLLSPDEEVPVGSAVR